MDMGHGVPLGSEVGATQPLAVELSSLAVQPQPHPRLTCWDPR